MAEPEDAEEFKARIQAMVDRYEAQFLPQKQRKVTPQQVRKMDEGAPPAGGLPSESLARGDAASGV